LLALVDQGRLGRLDGSVHRVIVGDAAWVDVRPAWLGGIDGLFERLLNTVPWQAELRRLHEPIVDVRRLLRFYGKGRPLPDPVLAEARDVLNAYYEADLGEPLCTAELCLYRDGRDYIPWPGDLTGQDGREDAMVAIVSLGTPRTWLLRPRHGDPAIGHDLGHGDLFVIGGACQRTWEHAIPMTGRATGPHISVQFRAAGVRW
jgi:alkylated DNA repair dioxygenase AlkB